jgi:hypothetical protein
MGALTLAQSPTAEWSVSEDGLTTSSTNTWMVGDTEITETKTWSNMGEELHGHVAETPQNYNDEPEDEAWLDFLNWVAQFDKPYKDFELHERFKIWRETNDLIRKTNAAADASSDLEAVRLRHNQYSDQTREERMHEMGRMPEESAMEELQEGRRRLLEATEEAKKDPAYEGASSKYINWAERGKVLPVQK